MQRRDTLTQALMLIDARALDAETLQQDICIVGAGPGGISLCREFLGQRLQVALLESGGFDPDPAAQALAGGFTYGDVKPSVGVNRRQFGGNASNWGVELKPSEPGLRHAIFDEIDFVERPWIANSGWPFDRQHLAPYYKRAQAVCGAGPFSYAPDDWESREARRWPLDGSGLETGMFQFSAAQVFLKEYRRELVAGQNVTLMTHASVVELVTDDSGQTITRVKVMQPGGRHFWVAAKVFILAAGAFENARLLLMSNRQQEAGIGNRHDVVGRYYHDHLQGRGGYLTPRQPGLFNQSALYDLRQVHGTSVMAYVKLSRAVLEKEKLLNINCFVFPKPAQRQNQAIDSFNMLRNKKFHAQKRHEVISVFPRESSAKHILNVACGLDYVTRMAYQTKTGQQSTSYGLCHGGWSRLSNIDQRFTRLELWHSIEQSPRPENRVTLSQDTDALGCPKLELHWQWPQDDIYQTLRAQQLIGQGMEKAGLGSFQPEYDPQGLPNIERPVGSHHLMGTTRMHVNARLGVVNADCQVHEMHNLFVAGSSTFPTGGYANPTLTIIAMAIRLADLLKTRLQASTPCARSMATNSLLDSESA
ncbi:MAG: oxidoreductase [Polaromonas sp.]|nr:oxidoreductase [Polaromonas sp.]